MKEMSKLTFFRGTAIIVIFSMAALSCINVVIQGESDLTGANGNVRAISITRVDDSMLKVYVLGSVHSLRVSPALSEAYERTKNAVDDLAYGMATSLRQSIENLMSCR